MTKKKSNHIHKYKKVNKANFPKEYWVYACIGDPKCFHNVKIDDSLIGKECICNRCNGKMLISKATLHNSNGGPMALPHCDICTVRKAVKPEDVSAVLEFLKEKGVS